MSTRPPRHSPVQSLLEPLAIQSGVVRDAWFALVMDGDDAFDEQLGICDVSGLRKWGVRGSGAGEWLGDQGYQIPGELLAVARQDGGGLVARFGADEYFVEEGAVSDKPIVAVAPPLHPAPHEEASFALLGRRVGEVLAQTCGVDGRILAADRIAFSRVAGVNCFLVREPDFLRVWCDASYALYLWETLVEICESLDGRVIGAAKHIPELLA